MNSKPELADRNATIEHTVNASVAAQETLAQQLSLHLRILEDSIKQFAKKWSESEERGKEAVYLKSLILARIEVFTKPDPGEPQAPLLFNNWLYDWLYPQPEKSEQSALQEFVVWTPDRGEIKYLAVSADNALHVATLELMPVPEGGYASGDDKHKAYFAYRSACHIVTKETLAAAERLMKLPDDGTWQDALESLQEMARPRVAPGNGGVTRPRALHTPPRETSI